MSNGVEGWAGSEEVNWDDIPDQAPKQPADGLYVARITETKADQSQKGNKQVVMDLELLAPYGGGELGYVQRKIRFQSITFTKDGAFMFKQVAKACGVGLPKGISHETLTAFAEDLLGKEPIVKIATNNKGFANVRLWCTPEMADEVAKGKDEGGAATATPRPAPRRKAK